jgi:hypothetical protein
MIVSEYLLNTGTPNILSTTGIISSLLASTAGVFHYASLYDDKENIQSRLNALDEILNKDHIRSIPN